MTDMTPAQKLRAALAAKDEKKSGTGNKSRGDNASYPFWNIPENTTATVRFLPDGNPNNPFFWVDRETIKLTFSGQVGGDYPSDKQVTVEVPCVDMFGETCPIIAETKPWWKLGGDKEKLARLYYKKRSYIFQGFVVNSPLEEESVPENPIRRFAINPSVYEIIKKTLNDPEMEELLVDYTGGRDFKIAKTKKGEYANYGTSSVSMKVRPLNEIEMVAIEQHGLYNLADYLGAKPDADGILMIKQMFHDSLAGNPFDFVAYGNSYRAYGDKRPAPAQDSETARPQPSRVAETTEKTAAAPQNDDAKPAPAVSDILERIRRKTMAAKG